MHIVVTEKERPGVQEVPFHFSFNKDVIHIGRARDGDIVLNDEQISRRHLRLTADRIARTITVEDCGSTFGTFIGEKDIGNERYVLRSPDTQIQIKPFVITATIDLFVALPTDPVEQKFLAALHASPSDDTTRAVYADWLEEQGRYKESKFLRAQLVVRDVAHPSDPKFKRASKELFDLSKKLSVGWRARVAMTFIESSTCPRSKARWPQEGLAFDLDCPKRWDEMQPTAFDGVRHCSVCNEEVTYCTSIAQAQKLAAKGKCIAVDVGRPRVREDLLDPTTLMRGKIAPPRVYLGDASYVDEREQRQQQQPVDNQ